MLWVYKCAGKCLDAFKEEIVRHKEMWGAQWKEGRDAWRSYLGKEGREWYDLVVEDTQAILNRLCEDEDEEVSSRVAQIGGIGRASRTAA